MQAEQHLVYVVDDETVIAETLEMILFQAGYNARAFEDPRMALLAAQSVPPDLLISDVVMAGMTGIDLAIRLRNTHPSCKILLFSGNTATADLLEGAHRQGYEFELLAKPVHPADLLAKLEGLLQESAA